MPKIILNGVDYYESTISGGGSGGHTIYDEDGVALAQENGLQFTGAVSVSDDSVNGRTVVDIEGGGNYYLNTLYSTEEKKIGYWTDGKTLYQKTFVFNATLVLNTNTWKNSEIALADYNFETLVGILGHGTGGTIVDFLAGAIDTGNYLRILSARPSDQYLIGCTLRYTKTTDTADPNPQIGNVIYLPAIYSFEERQVGVWKDGKPLYQKTVNLGSLIMDTSFHSVAHGISDFELMVQAEGSFYDGSQWRNIETYRPTSTYGVNINVTPTSINYINNWVSSVQQAYLTIWYTKTTDVAGSGDWTPSGALAVHYSTNEQVIGTWIDGKPLYQKSYVLPQTVNISSNTNLTAYMTDITSTLERLIYAFGCGNDAKSTSPFYIQFYNSQITAWATPAFDADIITIQYTKTTDV